MDVVNRLMTDIRDGIANDCLDEVEKKYVHPDLEELGDSLGAWRPISILYRLLLVIDGFKFDQW